MQQTNLLKAFPFANDCAGNNKSATSFFIATILKITTLLITHSTTQKLPPKSVCDHHKAICYIKTSLR